MTDTNPIIEAIEGGHVCREKDVDGFLQYLDRAECRTCREPFPCSVIKAARAVNARRLAAQSRAELRRLTPA